MARLDGGEPVRIVEQGVEEPVILYAGKALEGVYSVFDQPFDGKVCDACCQCVVAPVRNGPGGVTGFL